MDDDSPTLIRALSESERKAADMQELIDYRKQTFIDSLRRCEYSEPWFDAWIQVAANNLGHIAVALRIAKSEHFKDAAKKWDALMLSFPEFSNVEVSIRTDIILLVCTQGGNLPTVNGRTILRGRPKIAKAITRLLSLIKSDPELARLSSHRLYALAFAPLSYYLRDSQGAPNLSTEEQRRAPTIEAILTGIVTRIEAQLPFGMIHKPHKLQPEKLTLANAQQTQFERVIIDRLTRLFGKPHYKLCGLFVSAGMGRTIDTDEIRSRDDQYIYRERKARNSRV